MSLTNKQSRYLKSLGHSKKPVVTIGNKGITEAVVQELQLSIEHHELMKVRISAEDRQQRDSYVEQLCHQIDAILVQRIGNIALIYKAAQTPKIVLP